MLVMVICGTILVVYLLHESYCWSAGARTLFASQLAASPQPASRHQPAASQPAAISQPASQPASWFCWHYPNLMTDTEKRVDPEDGKAYTFDEICGFYKGLFKKKVIQGYWDDMTPVKTKKKKAKKEPEVPADPNVEVVRSAKHKFRRGEEKPEVFQHKGRKSDHKPQKAEAKGDDLGKQQEMQPGIDLFTKQDDKKFAFQYTIQNLKLCNLEFTIDISKSNNKGWANGDPAK